MSRTQESTVEVEVLLYDGFDELDGVGPYEVFQTAGAFGGDVAVRTVTLEERALVTASHGLRIGVDGVLDAPDVLVVPGGGWNAGDDRPGARREAERGAVPEAVRERAEAGSTVAAVCTGGMLLAEAGLLDGRPAVTHASALDDLRATDADVVDARVVDTGDVLTAGGITSGLDLALHLVGRYFGADVADRVARELEYDTDPSRVFVAGEADE
ncbi:DJ-1/PfpI family protein [Salinigranum halophilum]|jgi:transcriptional regulator GlxA family with amidase domain|uniref:DJ-1/PfpI family protein n=1 Tax=Salinigranum halophilum TaxID=2565931 RepID=UPI0010A8C682|nr:DJ-1/PfpI family protein [Salinigranum halophilum]